MNFKIVIMAIAGLAFTQANANAQSSKFDKNYHVCKKNGKHVICTQEEAMNNAKDFSARGAVDNSAIKSDEAVKAVYTNRSTSDKDGVAVAYEVPAEVHLNSKADCDQKIYITGAEAGYNKDNPYYTTTIVCVQSESNKNNPNIQVSYDQPGDIYKGENVKAHDGVKKNIKRNINYLDWRGKVPNDGGLAVK